MTRINVCRHNILRRSCETCDLEEDNIRLREALKEIAKETGTPYATIAIKALEG